MNKKIIALYTVMVLLMIVPQALATDYSVSLNLDTNFARMGPCSGGTMIKGTIENTGELTDTYTISPQDTWIITTPQKVTLAPGESKSIAIFMTPPCDTETGEYNIDITAESGNSKDTETLTIEVLRVHSVELKTSTLRTGCIGDTETFDLGISNLGKSSETFIITSTSGILEQDEIALESGESKKVTLRIPVTEDKKIVDVNVKSKTSYAEDQKTLQILGVNCYSQIATITPESKTMCIKESSDFTLTIKNTGTKEDTYTITTDFGELSSEALTIEAETEKKVKLTVSPEDMGQYTANIEVKSPHETNKLSVTIAAQNCKGVAVITIPKEKRVCKGDIAEYTVTVKNTGKTEDTIRFSSTMGELSEKEAAVEAGNTRELQLAIPTQDLDYDTYTVTVTAESDIKDTSESLLIIENCYSATLSAEPEIVKVCPGIDAVFTLTLENTGKNKDTYNLETSEGTLGQDVVELESLETKDILLTVPTDTEDKSVVINMFSDHSQDTKTVNISPKDHEKCYGYTINANPEIIEAQEYKGYMYTLTVKNTGEYASNFTISTIGGPEWVYIDPTAIDIKEDTEGQFYTYVSPPYGTESGTHNIDIEIKRDNVASKTITLKLILGSRIERPQELPDEPEEPEEAQKTYPVSIDTEKTYEINENQTETMDGAYDKDGEETQVTINFRTGSFIIEIDDTMIEDDAPELGENIYELTTEDRQYTVTIEFTEVNTTSDTYKFRVKSAEVTELPEDQTTPTGDATEERSPLSRNLIYATIIGLVIIILILFGPEIAGKTKNFFTEEVEEKKEEPEEEKEEPKPIEETEEQIPLEEIKGIGGKRAEALRKAGIKSANDLAEANISDIMAEAVTSEKQAKSLIKKAKAVTKKKAKKDDGQETKKDKKTKTKKKPKPRKEIKEDIKDILESI